MNFIAKRKLAKEIANWCDQNISPVLRWNKVIPDFQGKGWRIKPCFQDENKVFIDSNIVEVEIQDDSMALIALLKWS